MKRLHLVLGAALALAAGLAAFGDKTPDTGVAEPAARPARAVAPVARVTAAVGKGAAPPVLRLVPRDTLVGDSADQSRAGANELFGRQDWTPPPPPPPAAPPPPPPAAPPLPFTYIGKSVGDGAWEVYLARAERTYLVRENSVIDGTYRVDAIAPPILTLTYLPLNQVQQLNIGVLE
ncbi:MAG: hypothetical protein ACJ8LG_01170 [Massilia sp.]